MRKDLSISSNDSKKWEKADHPVHGMSFFDKIVFSHGFEIDVIKFRMFVEAAQYMIHVTDDKSLIVDVKHN